jgi:thioredoxin 1
MALEITDNTFDEVLSKTEISVVDFWAPWCGPCKILGPIIEQLSNENKGITIGKVNVDENSIKAAGFGIRGIPTTIFFKNGKETDRMVGMHSKAEFQAKIDSLK